MFQHSVRGQIRQTETGQSGDEEQRDRAEPAVPRPELSSRACLLRTEGTKVRLTWADFTRDGSVALLLDGYRDVLGGRDAMAAIVSDEGMKGRNASRSIFEERALAASAVFASGPQIGKDARGISGAAGLDVGIVIASRDTGT